MCPPLEKGEVVGDCTITEVVSTSDNAYVYQSESAKVLRITLVDGVSSRLDDGHHRACARALAPGDGNHPKHASEVAGYVPSEVLFVLDDVGAVAVEGSL